MRFIKTVVVVLLLLLVAGGAFIASGTYTIGADQPHWGVTEYAIALLRDRAIDKQAQGVAVPNLDDPKRLAAGAEHYGAMCTGCHLAPGQQSSELRQGLYPTPPDLTHTAARDPAQTFWIIKHGVKLSAMPAWGKTHDDESIWGLVAFVRKLPQMTPEQYQQAVGDAGEQPHHHHDHGGGDADQHEHGADDHAHDAPGDGSGHTHDHDEHGASATTPLEQRQAEVHAHGPDVMPFALDATQHVFEPTPTGGTQRVLARAGHSEQVPLIRAHLEQIAQAFAARDFSGPIHLHGADMPGLAEMQAAPAGALTVIYRELDDGGELSYRAETDALRDAVHRWFDAQLADHGHDASAHDDAHGA